jgi:hypothetical protein
LFTQETCEKLKVAKTTVTGGALYEQPWKA